MRKQHRVPMPSNFSSQSADNVPQIPRCYSAYEHAALHTKSPQQSSVPSSKNSQSPSVALPLDVSIETILSVVFICIGLVLGAEELKPISWRVWAGNTERESGGGGPFQGLEDRLGFVDIRVGPPAIGRRAGLASSLHLHA